MYTIGGCNKHAKKIRIFLLHTFVASHQSFITQSTEGSRKKTIHVEITTVKTHFLLSAHLKNSDSASLSVFLKLYKLSNSSSQK